MSGKFVRICLIAALTAICDPVLTAWHTPVHQMITGAALASLPADLQAFWRSEGQNLTERYCLYPDIYANAGSTERVAMRVYCETAQGLKIHNVNWKRPDDTAALAYVLRGLIRSVREDDAKAAAQYAGVLAHFLEDSTCPAHAFQPFDSPLEVLRDMLAPPPQQAGIRLHTVIEKRSPSVDLGARTPQRLGDTPEEMAEALLARVYPAIRSNRGHLIELGRAAYAGDQAAMDPHRLRAATTGAELLADALYSAQSAAHRR